MNNVRVIDNPEISALQCIENIHKNYPDVKIITAAIDDCLNKKGYIVPGMGDAGDRIFNTDVL